MTTFTFHCTAKGCSVDKYSYPTQMGLCPECQMIGLITRVTDTEVRVSRDIGPVVAGPRINWATIATLKDLVEL